MLDVSPLNPTRAKTQLICNVYHYNNCKPTQKSAHIRQGAVVLRRSVIARWSPPVFTLVFLLLSGKGIF